MVREWVDLHDEVCGGVDCGVFRRDVVLREGANVFNWAVVERDVVQGSLDVRDVRVSLWVNNENAGVLFERLNAVVLGRGCGGLGLSGRIFDYLGSDDHYRYKCEHHYQDNSQKSSFHNEHLLGVLK